MKRLFLSTACIIAALIAMPVQACQLMCVVTAKTYDGNLGGLAGADTKCSAEYPSFKFARSGSYLTNIVSSGPLMIGSPYQNSQYTNFMLGSPLQIFNDAWIGNDSTTSSSTINCSGYTTNGGGYYGSMISSCSIGTTATSLPTNYSFPFGVLSGNGATDYCTANASLPNGYNNCSYSHPLVCCNM